MRTVPCPYALPMKKLDPSEWVAYEHHILLAARDLAQQESIENLGQVARALKALCATRGDNYSVAAHNILSQIDRDEHNLWPLKLSGLTQDEWYLTRLLECAGEKFDYGF
jgi:hypothetical protein